MYGNVFKYLYRYRYKNGVEDLKKALWYLRNTYISEQPKETSTVLWATYDLLNDIIKSEPDRLAQALFTSFRALVFYGDASLFSVLAEVIAILEEKDDEETQAE